MNFKTKTTLCCTQQFISRASDEIQSLFSLHVSTSDDFNDVVQYFGENPRETTSAEWFTDIAVFVNKFEVEQLPLIRTGSPSSSGSGRRLSPSPFIKFKHVR